MAKALLIFRIILVTATAAFMAFHTQKFISRIEPDIAFAWLASLLIEGMLISLALMRTWASRAMLIPLFLISVMAASASFIVKNEVLLEQFFQNREAAEQSRQSIELLNRDLKSTEKEFNLGSKYTTSTLRRERQIKDQIAQILMTATKQDGHLILLNSALFFVLVLVLQGVSVFTAMSLKKGFSQFPVSLSQAGETQEVSYETVRQACENRRNGDSEVPETQDLDFDDTQKPEDRSALSEGVLRLKAQGVKPDEIARQTGLSRATIYRILKKSENL